LLYSLGKDYIQNTASSVVAAATEKSLLCPCLALALSTHVTVLVFSSYVTVYLHSWRRKLFLIVASSLQIYSIKESQHKIAVISRADLTFIEQKSAVMLHCQTYVYTNPETKEEH
jgi:hypothetical protein